MARMSSAGKIIIDAGVNVWSHELETAKALTNAGKTVEFIRRSEEQRVTSADVVIDDLIWEMKAPTGEHLRVIDKNLRKALHQSNNVIFDSCRMKKVPDTAIERELRKCACELKSLHRLLFVNRKRGIIDIK